MKVNPPGATPVLTLDQVWAGLELKRKKPQLFLAVIDTCEVLEDDGETVLREVKFKDGISPPANASSHINTFRRRSWQSTCHWAKSPRENHPHQSP